MKIEKSKILRLRKSLKYRVIAMGAELKNTIAFGNGDIISISAPHGNLSDADSLEKFERSVDLLKKSSDHGKPEVVAVDLHPDMHSTITGFKIAEELSVPVVAIQHHHAHAAACMAEHGLETALALVFDGTGLGTDGKIWGAELLSVTPLRFSRLASFAPVPLPGGDAAVRHPVRQVVARFHTAGLPISDYADFIMKNFNVSKIEIKTWIAQCENNFNAPLSHGAGRLFDSFSAILGLVPGHISHDAEPAIQLEKIACKVSLKNSGMMNFSIIEKNNMLLIDWSPLFRNFHKFKPENFSELALEFHNAVANSATKMAEYGMGKSGFRNIILSGGVFVNRILNELLLKKLSGLGLNVFVHSDISTGDAGISAGQAVIAGNMIEP